MARRLYIGRLPQEVRSEELSGHFEPFGRLVDCRVMTGFGFVEFEDPRDAEEALEKTDGSNFQGGPIVVQFAKEGGRRRDRDYDDRDRSARARRPPGIRVIVSGLSRETSWQDLKDFGREIGNVSFADIDREAIGEGVLEYLSREDAERAVRELSGRNVRGRDVKVTLDETRGVDNYRRDMGRERFPEDGYKRRRSPKRDDYARRSRSPRRDYDRERRRSPPRARDYDRRERREDDRPYRR